MFLLRKAVFRANATGSITRYLLYRRRAIAYITVFAGAQWFFILIIHNVPFDVRIINFVEKTLSYHHLRGLHLKEWFMFQL